MSKMIRKPSELGIGNIVIEDGRAVRVVKHSELEHTEQGAFFFFVFEDLLTGREHLSGIRSSTLLECR